MNLIEEIKKVVKMEVRPNSEGLEYLEAVLTKKDLNLLESMLIKHLGPATKNRGKELHLPEAIQEVVDSIGGLWPGQSFFYKQEGHEIIFAALWPWLTDPDKVTLKSGKRKLSR
ncbi:MAG: hypothetical protein ACE144_09150 [Thermodesulfobacteriota bacterium]